MDSIKPSSSKNAIESEITEYEEPDNPLLNVSFHTELKLDII